MLTLKRDNWISINATWHGSEATCLCSEPNCAIHEQTVNVSLFNFGPVIFGPVTDEWTESYA